MDFDWSAWVGLPYQALGRGPEGYDCWGLIRAVIHQGLGVSLPVFLDYTDTDIPMAIKHYTEGRYAVLNHWHLVTPPFQPFDVVIFRTADDASHVGVVCEPGRFLHLARDAESLIERFTSRRWALRLEGGYRYGPL